MAPCRLHRIRRWMCAQSISGAELIRFEEKAFYRLYFSTNLISRAIHIVFTAAARALWKVNTEHHRHAEDRASKDW